MNNYRKVKIVKFVLFDDPRKFDLIPIIKCYPAFKCDSLINAYFKRLFSLN